MRSSGLVLLIVALILSGCSQAGYSGDRGTPAAKAPVWLTEQEWKALDGSSERAKSLDVFVVLGGGPNIPDGLRVEGAAYLVKFYLRALHYDVPLEPLHHPYDDAVLYGALAAFERDAGLATDGVFTLGEFERLQELGHIAVGPQINLPLGKFVGGGPTYVSASGTWVMQGEQIAYPLNTSEITCERESRTCRASIAQVDKSGPNLQAIFTEFYDVESWQSNVVVARRATSCREIRLTLNVTTKQAFSVATDLTREGCDVVGALKKPRVTTLEDGFVVAQELHKAELKRLTPFPIHRMRQRLFPSQSK